VSGNRSTLITAAIRRPRRQLLPTAQFVLARRFISVQRLDFSLWIAALNKAALRGELWTPMANHITAPLEAFFRDRRQAAPSQA
jgi:hypothetical protein